MNLLSQLLSASAPLVKEKRKHARDLGHLKDNSRYNHVEMVAKARALTGKSFISTDLLAMSSCKSDASRVCRMLVSGGHVTVEYGAVPTKTKPMNRYTWKDDA